MLDENDFFRQATLRISSSLNTETAMERCMDYLKAHIPVSGMVFTLYDSNLNVGKVLCAIWPEGFHPPERVLSIPKEFWGWVKKEWEEKRKIRLVNDITREEKPMASLLRLAWPDHYSHLLMDLALEDRHLGILHLFTEGQYRYKDEHARLLYLLHEPFAVAFNNILQHREILRLKDSLADDNVYLRSQMMEMTGDTIIGADFGLRDVMAMVRQVAPLNSPVLLMGETGVGKEVIANAIHHSSARRNNPFIRVNCGAIPDTLIDSELFGHEKGAFTGALSAKRGRFERAHTGTIFLDEVAELPLAAQVRLLRVLQQREIERVGGTEVLNVDVRIISATHRNLADMVRAGKFREDLWFRLNVFPITIPPLRQRFNDIPALVSHFLDRKSRELKIGQVPSISRQALEYLQSYHWPGNVRELENFLERALIHAMVKGSTDVLDLDSLPLETQSPATEPFQATHTPFATLDDAMRTHIRKALSQCKGKVEGDTGAAALLGLHPSTLRARMKKLSIPYGRGPSDNRKGTLSGRGNVKQS